MSDLKQPKAEVQPKTATLSDLRSKLRYDDVLHCNRCGFCTSFCPTYLATGDEGLSPRGRNQAFRALVEGRLQDPEAAARLFSSCLQCGICTSVCFSEVPTAKLMSSAREKLLEQQGEPLLMRFVLRFLLPRPRIFGALLWFLFLGKRLGISRVLNRLGLLRRISPALAAAEEMSDRVPLRFLRSRLRGKSRPAEKPEIIYFAACGPNYLRPDVGVATAALLQRSAKEWTCGANVCCGLPGMSTGDVQAARRLAKRNIEEFEKSPDAVILSDDSSCVSALKEYPHWFEGEDAETLEWRKRAENVSQRVKDLSEWLIQIADSGSRIADWKPGRRFFDPKSEIRDPKLVVTYHDPCKARYGQNIVDQPRTVLRNLPVEFHELPDADQCCGGGGSTSFLHPEVSRAVLDRKIDSIVSTGADVVITSSVSCLLQLLFGLRRRKSAIKGLHLSEFLAGTDPRD